MLLSSDDQTRSAEEGDDYCVYEEGGEFNSVIIGNRKNAGDERGKGGKWERNAYRYLSLFINALEYYQNMNPTKFFFLSYKIL